MKTSAVLAFMLGATLTANLAGCATEIPDSTANPSAVSADNRDAAPALDGTSGPPWPAPANVPAHVAGAGLDLGPMGMAEHYHPHLRIHIDGTEVPVPANIGVDPATGAMSAVHTHDDSGTIHVEAANTGEVFTLGQLFTEWSVKLTRTQIGGVRAARGQHVVLTSDGSAVAGDPTKLRLAPDQRIELSLR